MIGIQTKGRLGLIVDTRIQIVKLTAGVVRCRGLMIDADPHCKSV